MTAPDTNAAACAYYDGECRFCIALVVRFEGMLAKRDIDLMPLQTAGAAALLGIPDDRLLTEMRLRASDGRVFGGAEAVMEIARRIWWAWPLWALSRVPGVMPPMRALYRWIARHRSCADGVCETSPRSTWSSALPLLVLPILAMMTAPLMPRWVFMWAMAFAIYAGCKWLTLWQAVRLKPDTATIPQWRVLGYLLAWPGMDPQGFLEQTHPVEKPGLSEWIAATLKTALGGILVWQGARVAAPISVLLSGWVGMIGAVFVLHFGIFHLLSLCWRRTGIDAMPMMRNPMRATSLGEFWGRRWNTAFHELATRFTFHPLRRRLGVTAATLLTFIASGLIHELVITVPAGAAYGWPTGYFVLQGLGVAGERTTVARRLGLGAGWRGWLYTVVLAAGPAAWLFPPAFVQRVILPMLGAIGAL